MQFLVPHPVVPETQVNMHDSADIIPDSCTWGNFSYMKCMNLSCFVCISALKYQYCIVQGQKLLKKESNVEMLFTGELVE